MPNKPNAALTKKEDFQLFWNSLGLVTTVISKFGTITKRRLHETLYLLSRLNKVHGRYQFEFQYYMPFSYQLEGDLILLEQWKAITIDKSYLTPATDRVKTGKTVSKVLAKATNFLKHSSHIISSALQEFSRYSDIEFDLIALTIFIIDDEQNINIKKLLELIAFYRPKVNTETTKHIIETLQTKGIIGGVEIRNVIASDIVVEKKTGYWKKQLNEMTNRQYMVEVYLFNLDGVDRDDYYIAWFNTEEEATDIYKQLTSMKKVKKLLTKSLYSYNQNDLNWPLEVY